MNIIFSLLVILTMTTIGFPKHYVSTTNITVGETIQYFIDFPPNIDVTIQLPTINGFEMLEQSVEKRSTVNSHRFTLQAFSIDNMAIPSMSFTMINGLDPIELPPIYFTVTSLLSPTMNQLNDIAPLISLFQINWMFIVLGLFLVTCIALGIYSWRRKQQEIHQLAVIDKREPPIDYALKRLKILENSLSSEQALIKQGYFELTEIFFTYITDSTQINVIDATTVEMQRLFNQKKPFKVDDSTQILTIAREIDHYKFSENPAFNINRLKETIQQIKLLIKKVDQ
jgi:hypothetical protein